ncbi:MAG: GGDEF domain-containing protein, partial [Phascolarctobacterium sp.]
MDAAISNTTLHCLRGHAPTPACLCKLQKLSLILEASQLEAFEYSSKEDRLIIYDNCLNKLHTVEQLLQNIDNDANVHPTYRAKVKQFFLGDVGEPVETQGTRLSNGQFMRCVMEGMFLPSEQDNSYVILGTIKDITDFAKKEEQLTQKAQMDQLTGLYNHASGMYLISQHLADKSPFDSCALAMVDLDYFKQINDTYGHLFGDHVLKETASIFKEVLPSNTIASRFGGDEFVLFFPSINRIDLITILNRLMQHIRNVEMLNDSDNLTCSIGICFLPENTGGYTYDQLLENADWALYQAKFNGRDTYSFCDDLNRYLEARNSENPSFQQLNIRYLQNDPIATAFEILETSSSVEQGMELLLKIIGIRFHLDRINVVDIKLKEQTASKAYAWMRDGVYSCLNDIFSFSKDEFRKIFQLRDETGLIQLDLEDLKEGFPVLNKIRETTNGKTVLIAPMFWQGQMVGFITYAVCNQKRYWSKNTKQQLSELSKIIAAHHGQSRNINA